MRLFITNIYGYGKNAIEKVAQNMVADIAIQSFDAHELGIYAYDYFSDNEAMLFARLDGILAAVQNDDVVILQSPTWNMTYFEIALIQRLKIIAPKVKLIIFVHDMPPLMFDTERRFIPNYVEIYNCADVIIMPSQRAVDFWKSQGMSVNKVLIQHMWDHPVTIDESISIKYEKRINFAGNAEKFDFVKEWSDENVCLAVTANPSNWPGKNIDYLGWLQDDTNLVNSLRRSGGFGLHWATNPYWWEYMKLNASYKLSTYLVAGLPVIVPKEHPEAEFISKNKLGFSVESLEDAIQKVVDLTPEAYREMADSVDEYAVLLRNGFIVRNLITEAICKLYRNEE